MSPAGIALLAAVFGAGYGWREIERLSREAIAVLGRAMREREHVGTATDEGAHGLPQTSGVGSRSLIVRDYEDAVYCRKTGAFLSLSEPDDPPGPSPRERETAEVIAAALRNRAHESSNGRGPR